MRCKLNLIEPIVLAATLGLLAGLVVSTSHMLIIGFHFNPWLAVPAAIALVGAPVGLIAFLVNRLDRRLTRHLLSKQRKGSGDSEDSAIRYSGQPPIVREENHVERPKGGGGKRHR